MTNRRYTIVSPDGTAGIRWETTEADARHYATLRGNARYGDRLVGPRGETLGTVVCENINENGTTVGVRTVLV